MINKYEHETVILDQGKEAEILISFNFYEYTRTVEITKIAVQAGRSWWEVTEAEAHYIIFTWELFNECEIEILKQLIASYRDIQGFHFNRIPSTGEYRHDA